MLERSRARRQALYILYQREVTGQPIGRILTEKSYIEDEEGEPGEFCVLLVTGAEEHIAEIDRRISSVSENWVVSRMPLVDRNILRLAAFEIAEFNTPAPVVIDEALDLARQFSGDESVSFINGVLDAIHRDKLP